MTDIEPIVLDVDLNQVDTSIPVIKPGLYDMEVADITKEENKDKTGYNLKVKFVTKEPAKSHKDEEQEINAGFPLFKYYPLQKKEGGSDKFDWRVGLAQLIDACLGTEMGNRPGFNASELLNKTVRVAVAVSVNKDTEQPQNEIKRISYPQE